jgi:hypothetical protein
VMDPLGAIFQSMIGELAAHGIVQTLFALLALN